MKFGRVDDPSKIKFKLPPDHVDTARVLGGTAAKQFEAYVGCAKWNRADLKNFYPRGTKNELEYYSSQFNCIELNATFYRSFPAAQFHEWKKTVPHGFRFFPKMGQQISHWKRLLDVGKIVDEYVGNFSLLGNRLGGTFLQLHTNFAPKDIERVRNFVADWKYRIPLAVEFRHPNWYSDQAIADETFKLFRRRRVTSVLVDTAGRRDMLHMRLTTPTAFVRYVGANHPTDYRRLDAWVKRIAEWKALGLRRLCFFVHQNVEVESPLLSAYFIKKLNRKLGTELPIPQTLGVPSSRVLSTAFTRPSVDE